MSGMKRRDEGRFTDTTLRAALFLLTSGAVTPALSSPPFNHSASETPVRADTEESAAASLILTPPICRSTPIESVVVTEPRLSPAAELKPLGGAISRRATRRPASPAAALSAGSRLRNSRLASRSFGLIGAFLNSVSSTTEFTSRSTSVATEA